MAIGVLDRAFCMQALQLVDSDIETTRRYWRHEFWGLSEEIAGDPRPLREILGAWPDWRTPLDQLLSEEERPPRSLGSSGGGDSR